MNARFLLLPVLLLAMVSIDCAAPRGTETRSRREEERSSESVQICPREYAVDKGIRLAG